MEVFKCLHICGKRYLLQSNHFNKSLTVELDILKGEFSKAAAQENKSKGQPSLVRCPCGLELAEETWLIGF